MTSLSHVCSFCGGRGFFGTPGARCPLCDGKGVVTGKPTPLCSCEEQGICKWCALESMTPKAKADPVVEANVTLLRSRSEVGVRKYGVTLEAANLSLRQLLVHALEETLDHANYLQAAIRRIDAEGK